MRHTVRYLTILAAAALTCAAVRAERVTKATDMSFELHRIVSLNAGGTSESIGPGESEPRSPIFGPTTFYGTGLRFAQSMAASVWDGKQWRPTPATLTMEVIPGTGTGDGNPAIFSVVIRFTAGQAAAIYNRWVLFQLFDPVVFVPGAGPANDTVEMVFVRKGAP